MFSAGSAWIMRAGKTRREKSAQEFLYCDTLAGESAGAQLSTGTVCQNIMKRLQYSKTARRDRTLLNCAFGIGVIVLLLLRSRSPAPDGISLNICICFNILSSLCLKRLPNMSNLGMIAGYDHSGGGSRADGVGEGEFRPVIYQGPGLMLCTTRLRRSLM